MLLNALTTGGPAWLLLNPPALDGTGLDHIDVAVALPRIVVARVYDCQLFTNASQIKILNLSIRLPVVRRISRAGFQAVETLREPSS